MDAAFGTPQALMMIEPRVQESAPAVSTTPRTMLLLPVRESTSGTCTLLGKPRKRLAKKSITTKPSRLGRLKIYLNPKAASCSRLPWLLAFDRAGGLGDMYHQEGADRQDESGNVDQENTFQTDQRQ